MRKQSFRLICSYISKQYIYNKKPDIRDNFVFRMGELHVVFYVLKVLGKLIDGSRLDQAFVEADS